MNRFMTGVLLILALRAEAHQTLVDGIRDLATQISATATKQSKQKIAVLPFRELDGQSTVLGTYVAEELVTNLVQLGNFNIVERQLLQKVLTELKIEQTGAVDPSTAKQVGKLTGVDAIVTGSITDLTTFVGVNCRLIDTTTGQVFGAARTTVSKDSDVEKLMTTVLSDENTASTPLTFTPQHPVATKDIQMLRVSLQSVRLSQDAVRWTLQFTNRDSRQPLLVAMNAETASAAREYGVRIVRTFTAPSPELRASVVDERGGLWKLSSSDVNIGFVRAGVHGRHGEDRYSPTEIGRLMKLRDDLGRSSDDPADGIWAKATGMGEGGMNITYGAGGNTSPEQFFRFYGNTFIAGTPTTIAPGQSLVVTMTFRSAAHAGNTSATTFQFQAELVIGDAQRGYVLDNVTFDRVSISTGTERR